MIKLFYLPSLFSLLGRRTHWSILRTKAIYVSWNHANLQAKLLNGITSVQLDDFTQLDNRYCFFSV